MDMRWAERDFVEHKRLRVDPASIGQSAKRHSFRPGIQKIQTWHLPMLCIIPSSIAEIDTGDQSDPMIHHKQLFVIRPPWFQIDSEFRMT